MIKPKTTFTNGKASLGYDTIFNWVVLTKEAGWFPINQMRPEDIQKVLTAMGESKDFPADSYQYLNECYQRFTEVPAQQPPASIERGKAITNFAVTLMLDGEDRWRLLTHDKGWALLEEQSLETLVSVDKLMSNHAVFPPVLRQHLLQLIAQHKQGPSH